MSGNSHQFHCCNCSVIRFISAVKPAYVSDLCYVNHYDQFSREYFRFYSDLFLIICGITVFSEPPQYYVAVTFVLEA